MGDLLRLDDAIATHHGRVRAANEDSAVALLRSGVWMVADGMGGYVNGKQASQTLIDALVAAPMPEDDFSAACSVTAAAIHSANAAIFAEAQRDGIQMGSTVVALVMRGRQFAVLWAGDSRAYLYRDAQLLQLTVDHTQVQAMIDRGLLSPKDAANHPMGHVLARAVGVQADLELDAISDEARPGDIFLLCSDGLHGVLNAEQIAAALAQSGRGAADSLVEQVLECGAPDNVTILLVSAQEPTALLFASSLEAK